MSNAILYTMPGTCALAPNIAVAWLNAPVTIKTMERGNHKKDPYLSINPKGKVPALQFDDGDVLTEAAAILAYLGAKYGKEDYARNQKLGRKEAEALSYMTSEVHAAYGPHFAVQTFADSDSAQKEIKAKTYEKLAKHYERLESNLAAAGDWYLKDRSFADAFLYVLTRWIELTPLSIDNYPNLKKHRARMEADEGVKLALQRQNMEPLSSPGK
jgi:glutathione S-transferase